MDRSKGAKMLLPSKRCVLEKRRCERGSHAVKVSTPFYAGRTVYISSAVYNLTRANMAMCHGIVDMILRLHMMALAQGAMNPMADTLIKRNFNVQRAPAPSGNSRGTVSCEVWNLAKARVIKLTWH